MNANQVSLKPRSAGLRLGSGLGNGLIHLLLAFLSFVWVLPIAWIVMTSLRVEKGSYISTFFPKGYTLDNYARLFTDTKVLNFPRMFTNTLIVAIFTCILSTFFVLSVAYVMSRLRFRMRRPMMNIAMILGLFPGFMSVMAVYYILKAVGLSEGGMIPVSLILVYSGGAGLGFYISKGFFDTIPRTLDEAALLDGCTQWQLFTRITLPISKPIVVFTILNAFLAPWLDFIFARVVIRANADYYTVSIGLWRMLEREYIHNWYTSFAAGAVLVSIPIAILFIFLQRFYTESMSGAVKG